MYQFGFSPVTRKLQWKSSGSKDCWQTPSSFSVCSLHQRSVRFLCSNDTFFFHVMLWHIHIHTSSDTSDEERLITLVPARAVQPFNNLRPKYRRDIFNIVGPKYFQQLAPKISSRYFHHRGTKIFSPPSTQKKSYYFLQSVPKIFPEYF